MSNEIDVKDGYPRPHSPPSLDDAELLRFVSKGSSDGPSFPPLAQASMVSPPESSASSVTVLSLVAASTTSLANNCEAAKSATTQRPTSADEGDDSDSDDSLPPVNCTADGKLHIKDNITSPNQRPRVNRPVDHTYTDYAMISDDELRRLDQDSSVWSSPALNLEKKRLLGKLKEMPSKSASGVTQSFPSKLHQVLANSELAEIISWMPHGRCFVIHQAEVLASEVLPRFFNQTKFFSFIRQLNLWGFKRLTRGVDGKAYYHELFLRGRPYLALRLKRMKIKGHGYKPVPNPAGEPNFYKGFPPVGDMTTIGFASCERISSSPRAKEIRGVSSKKRVVTSGAESATSNQTKMAGLGNENHSWDAGTTHQSHNQCDGESILLTPALTCIVPAVAASLSAGVQNTAWNIEKTNPLEGVTISEASLASTNSGNPISLEVLASLRSRRLAVHAASNSASHISSELKYLAGLESALVASPLADQLAEFVRFRTGGNCLGLGAVAHARLAVLAGLRATENTHQGSKAGLEGQIATSEGLRHADVSHIRFTSASNTGIEHQNSHLFGSYNSSTAQPKTEDCLLADRLSQLRREQDDIALMCNARFYEELAVSNSVHTGSTLSGLEALSDSTNINLNSSYVQGQPLSYFSSGFIPLLSRTNQAHQDAVASCLSSITDPFTVSVTEALREANYLEELALASRARARNLALVGALEVQPRYDAFLKNPLNDEKSDARLASDRN